MSKIVTRSMFVAMLVVMLFVAVNPVFAGDLKGSYDRANSRQQSQYLNFFSVLSTNTNLAQSKIDAWKSAGVDTTVMQDALNDYKASWWDVAVAANSDAKDLLGSIAFNPDGTFREPVKAANLINDANIEMNKADKATAAGAKKLWTAIARFEKLSRP